MKMKVLDHMVDFIKLSKVWSLSMELYGAWQLLAMLYSLKMSILQIWVTWASNITLKNLQLCSTKIKGSHTPCDVTHSCSISMAGTQIWCNLKTQTIDSVPYAMKGQYAHYCWHSGGDRDKRVQRCSPSLFHGPAMMRLPVWSHTLDTSSWTWSLVYAPTLLLLTASPESALWSAIDPLHRSLLPPLQTTCSVSGTCPQKSVPFRTPIPRSTQPRPL